MNGDTPCAKVGHAQYATDDISSQAVEDQHLPDRLAVCVEYGRCLCGHSIGDSLIALAIDTRRRGLVEIEHLLDCG